MNRNPQLPLDALVWTERSSPEQPLDPDIAGSILTDLRCPTYQWLLVFYVLRLPRNSSLGHSFGSWISSLEVINVGLRYLGIFSKFPGIEWMGCILPSRGGWRREHSSCYWLWDDERSPFVEWYMPSACISGGSCSQCLPTVRTVIKTIEQVVKEEISEVVGGLWHRGESEH